MYNVYLDFTPEAERLEMLYTEKKFHVQIFLRSYIHSEVYPIKKKVRIVPAACRMTDFFHQERNWSCFAVKLIL